MKKLAFISSAIAPLLTPISAFAVDPSPNAIKITGPTQGFKSLTDFVGNTLTLAFAVGILVVLAMLIWGAFEWITSGGDKENVGKARGRIINALIGLAVLAIAYVLARVAAQFLGFDIANIEIPTPDTSPPPSGTL